MPDIQLLRLCGQDGLWYNYSLLPFYRERSHKHYLKLILVFQQNFVYKRDSGLKLVYSHFRGLSLGLPCEWWRFGIIFVGNGRGWVLIVDKEEHTSGSEGPADIRKNVLMVALFAFWVTSSSNSELLPPLHPSTLLPLLANYRYLSP